MGFELYRKTRTTAKGDSVTISAAGVISVSPALSDKYFPDGVEHVQLYFDSLTKRVGIKPLKKSADFSYKIFKPTNSRRVAISGRGFLKANAVMEGKSNKAATFEAKFDDKEGMIIFSVRA